jgi:oligosaccharyltransferase complex subunit alpha (ribophorin I)
MASNHTYPTHVYSGAYIYKITLPQPLKQEQEMKLGIRYSYAHLVEPLPKKIPQVARQHVKFKANMYLLSPYSTSYIKTTLR